MKKNAGKRREERYARLLSSENDVVSKALDYAADRQPWRRKEMLLASLRHGRLVATYINGAVTR